MQDFHDFVRLFLLEAFAGKPVKHRGTLLKKRLQCGQEKRAAEHSRTAEVKESGLTGSKLFALSGRSRVPRTYAGPENRKTWEAAEDLCD